MLDFTDPIVFMGTPDFAASSLKALLDAGIPVKAVVTQPDRPRGRGQALAQPPVKELALAHGIPVHQPAKIRTPEFETWLREQNPQYVIVVAYGRILPANILAIPAGGCINVHASLLPRWRGASPIQWSIVNGDAETGITTMLMDEGLDTGPMLIKRSIPIGPEEDAQSLHDRLAKLGGEVLLETLRGLASGTVTPMPQPNEGATYAPLLEKDFGAIDWHETAQTIHNRIRGLSPWPGAFTYFAEKYVKVLSATVAESEGDDVQAGVLLALHKEYADVGTGKGVLRILEVQPAGKKRMSAADFLRGARAEPGHRFAGRQPG